VRVPDRITIPRGIVDWPEMLHKLAIASNAAGLAGYEVADVKPLLVVDTGAQDLDELPMEAMVEISYKEASA
jgi:hypothetical protein